MPITAAELQFRNDNGVVLVNGRLNNLFGNCTTNAGTTYEGIEVRNLNGSLTLSGVRAWLTPDPRGGLFYIAYDNSSGVKPVADVWDGSVDPTTLTYSAPTTLATGVVIDNLPPNTKARIFCKRVVVGASVATPENNRVWVGGTSAL